MAGLRQTPPSTLLHVKTRFTQTPKQYTALVNNYKARNLLNSSALSTILFNCLFKNDAIINRSSVYCFKLFYSSEDWGNSFQSNYMLQLLCNNSKADNLDANMSNHCILYIYMHAWKIWLWFGSNNVVAMLLTINESYRYHGKLNRENFSKFSNVFALLKTNHNVYSKKKGELH